MPNKSTIIRVTIAFVAAAASIGGLLLIASDVGRYLFRGGVMVEGGIILSCYAYWSFMEQKAKNDKNAMEMKAVSDAGGENSSCEHEWFAQDEMLNHEPKLYRCLKCDAQSWG